MRLFVPVIFTLCSLTVPQVYAESSTSASLLAKCHISNAICKASKQQASKHTVQVAHKTVFSHKVASAQKAHHAAQKTHHTSKKVHPRKDVLEVQKYLHMLGYKFGHQDALMGHKTEMAIKHFQKEHHLRITGHVSPQLIRELKKSAHVKG